MKKLSRAELKNVVGGNPPEEGGGWLYSAGRCIGSVGEWEMTPPTANTASCRTDIAEYCSSGNGTCTYIQA